MRLSTVCLTLARFLLPPAIIGTVYLYTYPILQCSFPLAKRAEAACYFDGSNRPAIPAETAPFRLLALGDPQLEGDTSLPSGFAGGHYFPSLKDGFWHGVQQCGDSARVWCGIRPALAGLMTQDVPRLFEGSRKRVDLWGNDLYLAHIYWLVSWWTQPTHTVVLGDLLGSQWIGDDEFKRRSGRFWGKVFRGAEKVPREVTDVSGRVEVLGRDPRWRRRVMAVAGNHDVGYAGDLDKHRIERFEDMYGRVNWAIRFRLNDSSSAEAAARSPPSLFSTTSLAPTPPELRLVILNSMNLDAPAYDPELRQQSLDFLANQLENNAMTSHGHASSSANSATILLTHIPLHKPAGICVDAPYFSYFPAHQGGGIKEQNHLSQNTSEHILAGLLGDGSEEQGSRRGGAAAIVLNGHDHEGCDTLHYRRANPPTNTPLGGAGGAGEAAVEDDTPPEETPQLQQQRKWRAERHPSSYPQHLQHLAPGPAPDSTGPMLREITVRSMMGSFSGNAGLLSAWFEADEGNEGNEEEGGQGRWRFEYSSCMLGVHHIWWAVHVLDLVVVALGVVGVGLEVREEVGAARRAEEEERKARKI
ncbi:hypothetical protein LTR36_010977 [Oleoguttula mirabilis]|uniref:Calcineurin-like phosphoesterase domain-containing protein n=1 Tax=Oleoguttula mirabilis TaxID=1507867 RepID=A0AAV9J482_9PEZI|nr:hypothetical protein LTR36_010977 [Oleoguttula mirabilis]